MKLYQIAGCPFAWRTRIVLEEKKLAFDTVVFERDRPRPPELEALGPDAKSPTLFDGDVKLWESLVINEYLEDAYPERPLLPAEPAARARVREAIIEVDKKLMSKNVALMRELVFKPPGERDPKAIEAARKEWHDVLAVYDRKLAGRTFLVGEEFSLADVMLFTPIPTLRRFVGEGVPDSLSHLRAWLDRISARPTTRPYPPGD